MQYQRDVYVEGVRKKKDGYVWNAEKKSSEQKKQKF